MKTQVLVVDDSMAMRTILSGQLAALGYDTLEAENGRHALTVLAQQAAPPVLALVDWNMPEMNGLEFVSAVRADPALASVRLLVVTSEAELSQMMQALSAGADEYLMKPFSQDALQSKLDLLGVAHE